MVDLVITRRGETYDGSLAALVLASTIAWLASSASVNTLPPDQRAVQLSKTLNVSMMASKKDMRRLDLAIPYIDPPKDKNEGDMSGAMSSTMPMAAMFTRNRMIGWIAFVFSLQTWLGETAEQKRNAATPAYMSVLMSLMALAVTYFPLFMPPPAARGVAPPSPSP